MRSLDELAGAAHITDPRDIHEYVQLEGQAVFDDAARTELAGVADNYRTRVG